MRYEIKTDGTGPSTLVIEENEEEFDTSCRNSPRAPTVAVGTEYVEELEELRLTARAFDAHVFECPFLNF